MSKFAEETAPEAPTLELQGLANLTPRESEVLSLAAMGFQDQEIVEKLGISYHTLRTYWSRIRYKTGRASRQALAAAYIELRLHEAGFTGSVAELLLGPLGKSYS